MKVKIKGLVFVGFAAAILSANAMAADNTVTSKQYVDTKFQTKVGGGTNANKLVQATGTAGTVSYVEIGNSQSDVATGVDKVVTGNAVAAALADNGGTVENGTLTVNQNGNFVGSFNANQATDSPVTLDIAAPDWNAEDGAAGYIANKPTVDTTFNAESNNAATSAAIADYVADQLAGDPTQPGSGYQNESTANYQIGTANGGWTTLNAGLADGTYTTKSESNGVVTFDVDATTDTTLANAGTGGTDEGKIPTAGAVKAYVDSKTGANIISQTVGTATDKAPSENAVNQYVTVKGVQVNGTALTPDGNKNVNVTVAQGSADGTIAVNGTDVTVKNAEVTTNKVSSTTGLSASSSDTEYPSAKTVYDAIQNATHGNVIPAMPNTCTAAAPCVLTQDTTDGHLDWFPIQQAE